ncbi:MAG: riboflavin synthase subunit alpha [Parachlamydiaceae bacterium]
MFTGIIREIGTVTETTFFDGLLKLEVTIEDSSVLSRLETGASIAIDGVCLTVVSFDLFKIKFDVINETLERTTLKAIRKNQKVHVERSARFGDEIGGHVLSGHVFGVVTIAAINQDKNNCEIVFQAKPEWTKYLFPKGYIALNGASLTLVDVNTEKGTFTVHLIPETLRKTTFGMKKVGDFVNLELETQTQAIVETIERILSRRNEI